MERLKRRKESEGKRRPAAKLPAWVLLWVVSIGIILPLGLIFVLHLPAVQKQVIGYLIQQVTAKTGLKPEVERYRWLPFSGLHLQSLEVQSEGGEPILQCEKAQLSYRFTMRWPHIEPKELILEKPVLHLEKDRDGTWRIPQRKATDAGVSPPGQTQWLHFPWPKLKIHSGTIIARQDGSTIFSVRDLTGSLDLKAGVEGEAPTLKLDFGQWQGELLSPNWGVCRIQGEATYRNGTFSSEGLAISIGEDTRVSCRGFAKFEPDLALDVKADLDHLKLELVPPIQERLPYLKVLSGSLFLKHAGGVWHVDHDLRTDRGKLKGALEAEVKDEISLNWVTRFADLDIPLTPQAPASSLAGQLEIGIKAKDLKSVVGQGKIQFHPSKWGEQSISGGEITASYNQGVLSLKTDGLHTSLGQFSLRSTVDLKGAWDLQHPGEVKVDGQAEQANIEKVFSGLQRKAGGKVHLEARYGAGKFRNLNHWQGRMEGEVHIPGFVSLKFSGNYKDELLQADYDLKADNVETVKLWYPEWQGRGALNSRGTVKGRWPDFTWEGELGSAKLQYGEVLSESLSVKGKSRINGKAGPRDLAIKAQNFTIDGKKLGALNLELTQQDDTCRFVVKGEHLWGSSSAKFSGHLGGLWEFPKTVTINQGQITWKETIAALEGKLEVNEQQVVFHSLSLTQNKQKANLSGHISYGAGSDLRCSLDGINVGQLLKLFGAEEFLTGFATGQVHITGGPERPEMAMSFQISNASLRVGGSLVDEKKETAKGSKDFEPIDRLQLQGNYSRDSLQLQGELRCKPTESPVTFSARVPMRLSLKPFHAELNQAGELASNIKIVGLQAESILHYMGFLNKLGGQIEADAQISGTLNQPAFKASGKWQDGSLILKRWPHPIENIQIEFLADSKRLQIVKGDVKLLGGSATLKGAIDYRGQETAVLEAEGQNVNIPEFLGISGTVTGRAQLIQTPKGPIVTGDFRASKAGMNLGQFEKSLARNIDIIEGDEQGDLVVLRDTEKRENNYYNKLKMDLAVELPPSNVTVKGMGLDAEVTGSLKIEKPAFDSIRLNGMLQTVRGTYTFQGNALKIVDGQIVFLGSPKPDPHLKIVCQKEVRDVLLQVQVTGPLSRPKMNLSSVPAMNQVDILSYLLFNQPAGELGTKETFQLQNRATAWLSSETARALKSMLGNNPLAPDSIRYKSADSLEDRSSWSQTNKNTSKKEEGGVVEIGKYITPDLHVSYEKGVMGEERNQVQLEYRFNRHLSIQTQVGGVQSSGVDVFWRHDFGK